MTVTVNTIFTQDILKLDHSFLPQEYLGNVRDIRLMQEFLTDAINRLGEMSAKAQGLRKILTSTDKLRSSDHILYLLRDPQANNGAGKIIGLLKMGIKNLYLHDEAFVSHQVTPICILDFYILEEYQKRGYGNKLFEFVLADQGTSVHKIAIDNPSSKLENFLMKHYNVEKIIRQNNSFAVSNKFFYNIKAVNASNSGRSTPTQTVVGRYAAHQPPSVLGRVIHGDNVAGGGARTPVEVTVDRVNVPGPSACAQAMPPPVVPTVVVPVPKRSQRPSSLEVQPISQQNATAEPAAGSATSASRPGLTKKGYVDLKYHHNRLW